MRVEVIKNFLPHADIAELNVWVEEGVKKKWLDIGFTARGQPTTPDTRVTSRLYGARFNYPEVALRTSNKVREYCGIFNAPLIEGHGKDGIVVSCTFPGGDVYAHRDPRMYEHSVLRCNIMTQGADVGGVLYVGGQPVPIEVGDLHCYLASEHEHYVTTVGGNTPRVLWMFGGCVLAENWDTGRIKIGETA